MAYSTNAELYGDTGKYDEADIVQLTDEAGVGSVDTDKVDLARKRADSLIDAYAARRYAVPFAAPVPELVKGISIELIYYFLHDPENVERVEHLYTNNIKILKGISSGEVTLGVDPPPEESDSTKISQFKANTREFTRENLGKYW